MTLSERQLAQMRVAQANLMGDTCQIGTYAAGTADAFGNIPGSYTYATAIDCGFERRFDRKGANELHTTAMTLVNADAMLRVPHTTSITTRDRVKLTKRYGTDIIDEVYEVVGIAQRGPTATLVYLKQVTI